MNKLKGGPKNFWSAINQQMGKSSPGVTSVVIDGSETKDYKLIADRFNEFFTEKTNLLTRDCACKNYIIPDLSMGAAQEHEDEIFVTYEDVKMALKRLKPTKAQGFDEIPSIVLKHLTLNIITPLQWLFNTIIEKGIVPHAWKKARIVPVHKKGDRKLLNNYRPVSNISSLSKAFERCMVAKLLKIDHDVLFGSNQHAYRPGSSTITACLTIQDFISSCLDKNKCVLMYSIDLTSAFDLLRPSLLVKNLIDLGLNPKIIKVLLSFLTDRSGFVDVNNKSSSLSKIPIGCVQGSVLGPVLFNIYVRNLQSIVEDADLCVSYADDSYIGLACDRHSINVSLSKLKQIAEKHIIWLESLGMVHNLAKTEFIAFGYQGPPISLTINNLQINQSSNIKILGVQFSSNLSWSCHVNNTIKKYNSLGYTLKYLDKILSRRDHKRIIESHFCSVLFYGSPVWAGCLSYSDLRRVNALLFKTIRLHCWDFSRIFRNSELCDMSKIRSFNSTRILRDMITLHRLCTNPSNTILTLRLIEQSYSSSRFPAKLGFFDLSLKRVGRSSFINRSKRIAELITFHWTDLSTHTFKRMAHDAIPIYMP